MTMLESLGMRASFLGHQSFILCHASLIPLVYVAEVILVRPRQMRLGGVENVSKRATWVDR